MRMRWGVVGKGDEEWVVQHAEGSGVRTSRSLSSSCCAASSVSGGSKGTLRSGIHPSLPTNSERDSLRGGSEGR